MLELLLLPLLELLLYIDSKLTASAAQLHSISVFGRFPLNSRIALESHIGGCLGAGAGWVLDLSVSKHKSVLVAFMFVLHCVNVDPLGC